MTVEALAAAAVAAVTPFVSEMGKGAAKQAGEQLVTQVAAIYRAIKARFTGDAVAAQALASFEASDDAASRAKLTDILATKLKDDTSFADEVEQLVIEVQRSEVRTVKSSGDGAVSIGGDATGNIIVTGRANTVRSTQ